MYRELLDYFMESVKDMGPEQIEKLSGDILDDMEKIAAGGAAGHFTQGAMDAAKQAFKKAKEIEAANLAKAKSIGAKRVQTHGGLKRIGDNISKIEAANQKQVQKLTEEINKFKNGKELKYANKKLSEAQANLAKKTSELSKEKELAAMAKKHGEEAIKAADTKAKIMGGVAGLAGVGAVAATSKSSGYREAKKDDNGRNSAPIINKY